MSLLGLWVHELHRVPGRLGFTLDGDLFMLPIAVGLATWWSRRHSPAARAALLVYAAVNLVGGVASGLPLRWLPFVPDQSVSHYAAHAIYGLCQVPLLVLAIPFRTRRRKRRSSAPTERSRRRPTGVRRSPA